MEYIINYLIEVLSEYFREKSVNDKAKLCYDKTNKCYVISYYFTRQETFNKLNWEVICG